MPLEGEKLDELLSGYIDDQLSADEQQQVEQTLADRESARTRLDELKSTRRVLKEHFRLRFDEASKSPLGHDFRAHVVAAARRQAQNEGLPADHHVLRSTESLVTDPASPNRAESSGDSPAIWTVPRIATALAAMAAAILLVASFSGLFENEPDVVVAKPAPTGTSPLGGPGDGVTPELGIGNEASPQLAGASSDGGAADEPPLIPGMNIPGMNIPGMNAESTNQAPAEYVGEMKFGSLVYMLVVDVEVTEAAWERRVLQDILNRCRIAVDEPIVASDEVTQMIDNSRMTVPENSDAADGSDAYIFFVRAAMEDLGQALDMVYANGDSFPRIALDMGFDSPQTRLMQSIAQSTGRRFSINESFAAPMAVPSEQARPSPFSGIQAPSKYVSSAQRGQGFGDMPAMAAPGGAEPLQTLLLYVRVGGELGR